MPINRFIMTMMLICAAATPGIGDEPSKRPTVPASIEFVPDITYGQAGTEKLILDLAVPKIRTGPLPAVVFIHGGAWVSGSRTNFHAPMISFANLGYVCISVDYRLGPKHRFPAQVEDVKCAVRWLRANAKKYDIDKDQIAAVGASAGGHLAAMLGTTGGERKLEGTGGNPNESSQVRAMVCIAGPTDLALAFDRSKEFQGLLGQMLGGTPKDVPERYRMMSPISYVKKDTVPSLLIHGTADKIVPIEQAEVFQKALTKAGAEVDFLRIEGGGHSDFGKDSQLVIVKFVTFLGEHLKRAK